MMVFFETKTGIKKLPTTVVRFSGSQ